MVLMKCYISCRELPVCLDARHLQLPWDATIKSINGETGGGTIHGGCYQKHNWDSQFDPNLANRIAKRAVKFCPALTGGRGIKYYPSWRGPQASARGWGQIGEGED